MKILAIDPGSTSLGLYDGTNRRTFTVKGDRPERLSALAEALADYMQENGPYDFVVYEEQFVRGGPATKALFGAVGVVEAVAVSSGAGAMSVPQSTVRKWAKSLIPSLKGKELYREIATQYDPRMHAASEHECDAACVYYYVLKKGNFNGRPK